MMKSRNSTRRIVVAALFAAVFAIILAGIGCAPVKAATQTVEQALSPFKETSTPGPTVTPDESAPITNVVHLFAGFDPRKEPLEIEIIKEWDEDGVRYEQMYFTGQVFDGVKTRIYAYHGAPSKGRNLPGMLYCHGGGGSAAS